MKYEDESTQYKDGVHNLKQRILGAIEDMLQTQNPFDFIDIGAELDENSEEWRELPEIYDGENGNADLYAITGVHYGDTDEDKDQIFVDTLEKYPTYTDVNENEPGLKCLEDLPIDILAEIADKMNFYKKINDAH